MSVNILCGNVSKKRNSTYQPTNELIKEIECLLKDSVSEENPEFLLRADSFNYNYLKWNDHFYFVSGITYERNNLITVSCEIDALATHKADILNSTFYVAYSSSQGNAWLPDTRIPSVNNESVSVNTLEFGVFSDAPRYILSYIGKNGTEVVAVTQNDISNLMSQMNAKATEQINNTLSGLSFGTAEEALQSMTTAITKTDVLGNAFSNAPACIRSCHWTPFKYQTVLTKTISLGNYDTNITGYKVFSAPTSIGVQIAIPWQFSDWRRATNESIYLYLPLVGMINIDTASIIQESYITIDASYTLTDGNISYLVKAGNQIIGTYGGNCRAEYAIGINQAASAGEVFNTLIHGTERTVSNALTSKSMKAGIGNAVMGGLVTGYDTLNTAFSTHPSSIGGIGGGAGYGLDRNIKCYSVKRDTIIEPSAMASTMGLPTMKPMTLSTLTGYCECVNAHIAVNAHSDVIDVIDSYINSGFYIE